MNKSELVKSVAVKAAISQKDSAKVVEAFVDTVKDALKKGDKVQLVGFGSFEVRERKARKVKSPATGEDIQVPEKRVAVFRPGKELKEAVLKKGKGAKATKVAKPAKKK